MRAGAAGYKRASMEVWNEVAPRYHRRWAGAGAGPFQATKKLITHAGIRRGWRVLDVACGTGAVTGELARRVGDRGAVVGIDTSVTALRTARRHGGDGPNVMLINSDAECPPLHGRFDAVTCQYALFFFPDAPRALRAMRRHLADGGRLGISVHGRRRDVPFFGVMYDAVTRFIPDYLPPGAPDLERYGTPAALERAAAGAGFSQISVHRHTFRYSPGTFEEYWGDYVRYVAGPVRKKISALDRRQRAGLREQARENARPYTGRNGTIRFPWQVLILTARR